MGESDPTVGQIRPGLATDTTAVAIVIVWGLAYLFGALALVQAGPMVGSWTGTIQWAVSYDPGVAAVSMAAMDFVVAVALVYKTIQIADLDVDLIDEG